MEESTFQLFRDSAPLTAKDIKFGLTTNMSKNTTDDESSSDNDSEIKNANSLGNNGSQRIRRKVEFDDEEKGIDMNEEDDEDDEDNDEDNDEDIDDDEDNDDDDIEDNDDIEDDNEDIDENDEDGAGQNSLKWKDRIIERAVDTFNKRINLMEVF